MKNNKKWIARRQEENPELETRIPIEIKSKTPIQIPVHYNKLFKLKN